VKRQVHRVKLGGELGLRDADGVREQLLAALHDHASVQIDISGLTAIDISIVQVLIAAQKTAKHHNQSLKISAKAEGPLQKAVRRAGLLDRPGTAPFEIQWKGTPLDVEDDPYRG